MSQSPQRINVKRFSLRRLLAAIAVVGGSAALTWALWQPGKTLTNGRDDRGRNAIWMGHGWLGADEWFVRNDRLAQRDRFRSVDGIREMAGLLKANHIADVFPHLCPAGPTGAIAPADDAQVERFLDGFNGLRVMPWVGGVLGVSVHPDDPRWRAAFVESVADLLRRHPRLAGVHVNIEPCPSGTTGYLTLLSEIRAVLPPGKLLSVAAYPPPSALHPFPHVHWDEPFFREVANRSDQVAVMLYDTAQKHPKLFEYLVAKWSRESLAWAGAKDVLLGVAAYDDANSGWHDPRAENVATSLAGIHAALEGVASPANYQGVAVYSEWVMTPPKWTEFDHLFLRH